MNVQNIPDDDTGQAIKRWARDGSDLSRPMKIDFFVKVPDEAAGSRLSSDLALADFSISIEKDDESGRWTCYCAKTMIPDYQSIIDVEALLATVANRHGAQCDGFGSYGNAEV